ncbi:hypothetical protein FRC04_007613 [Tulasnella sp. 424]|nr:hypothetical protein FRC04_007613 [Tulasnella sp. 424]
MASPKFTKPLSHRDGPLVWVDCEMTGLNHKEDRIIEIAVLITNGNLEMVDEGVEFVIKTEKEILDGMNAWCVDQHGRSGLTKACIDSPHDYASVYASVMDYVKSWIPDQRVAILAGNSVHVDKLFLMEGMPDLIDHLHYRILDVSTLKELKYRWYPDVIRENKLGGSHRALDDIRGSIAELQFYRERIFKTQEEARAAGPTPSS